MFNKFLIVTVLLGGLFLREDLWLILSDLSNLNKEKVDYIIGILSEPTNFERRSVIRQTWLSYLDDLNDVLVNLDKEIKIKPYFIIGNQFCNLASLIKSDEYGCDQVKLNESLGRTKFLVNKVVKTNKNNQIYGGFIFEVNYDITINRLGVLNKALKSLDNHFKLNLLDLSNDQIVARISENLNRTFVHNDDYIYFDLKSPLRLNKGFIGQLWLDELKNYDQLIKFRSIRNDNFNLIKIVNVISNEFTDLKNLNNALIATSFDYSLTSQSDTEDKLKQLRLEQLSIEQNMNKIQAQLISESAIYKDIKFIDIQDTYRNLPDKLLRFLDYVNNRYLFKYFIKVDDDSFLNLPKILSELHLYDDDEEEGKKWFGNFRKNWQVNLFGKWAESNYQSIVYPPFACGTGYILSSDLVDWLCKNLNSLFRYQGEDVSMGIWLASILPNYEHDSRWICENDQTQDNYFSIGQLSTEDQVRLFKKNKF